MKLFLTTFFSLLILSLYAQPFKPDRRGYVNTPAFKAFCSKSNYTLIGTFDSLPNRSGMAAQVLKGDQWIYLDLKGKEYPNYQKLGAAYGFKTTVEYYDDYIDEMPHSDWGTVEPHVQETRQSYTGTFEQNGKTGYKYKDKIIVQPLYDDVEAIDQEETMRFYIVSSDKRYGICNYQGKLIVPLSYEAISSLRYPTGNCAFLVKNEGHFGILSRNNKITVPVEFDGLTESVSYENRLLLSAKGDLRGAWSYSGKEIAKTEYDWIDQLLYSKGPVIIVKKDGLFGTLNRQGAMKIPVIYKGLSYNEDGTVGFRTESGHGVMDTNGRVLLPALYTDIIHPEGGRCFFAATGKGEELRYGIFDRTGRELAEPAFKSCIAFGCDFPRQFYIMSKDKSYRECGLFDVRNLKWMFPAKYDLAETGCDYLVAKDTAGKYYGVVDQTGTFVIPVKYTYIELSRADKYAIARKNDKYGLVGHNDRVLMPFVYDSLFAVNYPRHRISYGDTRRLPPGYFVFTRNGLSGVTTMEQKVTIQPGYETIIPTAAGLICISGDTSSIFDPKGKLYTRIPHKAAYRSEGLFEWISEGALYGADLYGNIRTLPPKPSSRSRFDPTAPLPSPPIAKEEDYIYKSHEVEEQTEYPGGKAEMLNFIKNTLKYPEIAAELDIEGKCYLRLIVERDGSIGQVTVLKGVRECRECDKSAKDMVKQMPRWTPAKIDGKPVRSEFNLPVAFRLD